ncbi:phosphoenolpyruvate synthase [Laceyella tengchongensis]
METYVMHFHEIDQTHVSEVGGKGANLGELCKVGFPVPPGFCITTSAYRDFVGASGEFDEWLNELAKLKPEQLDQISFWGQRIRNHLLSLSPSEQFTSALFDAWKKEGTERAYAVRSSATAEDLPNASFAGQQETYLNVKGFDPLLEAVKKCWASLFTDRAIVYRIKNGFDHRSVRLSVVVQQMVIPDVSGIMFTADPITGHRNTVSIDAGFGLGEAFVSGLVTADLYKVRGNRISDKQIATKQKGIFAMPQGGTETRDLPPEQRQKQALPDEKILELAELGRRIKKHYGTEQDIEWCLEGDRFFILQSRPITSLYPLPSAKETSLRIYLSFGHKQMMTDYMKPLGISVLRTLVPINKQSVHSESNSLVEAGGRLFLDCTPALHLTSIRNKICANAELDDDLLALSKAIRMEEFQQSLPRRGVRRQFFRTFKRIFTVYGRAIPLWIKLFYFGDPQKAAKQAHITYQQNLARCRQKLLGLSGSERMKALQDSVARDVLKALADSLACTLAGLMAGVILERRVKKWLGEEVPPALHKSPPGNVTSEMGLMIGDLADAARDCPALLQYLETAQDETFYEGLRNIEGGEAFQAKLSAFMEKYGMRAPGEIDITRVRYREKPTLLVPSILSHIRSNKVNEHRENFNRGEQEAHEAIQSLLSRIRKTRGGARKAKRLARLISIYRHNVGIRELPKYIIIRHFALFREAILEEAEQLCEQGVLKQKEDIFYFTLDELVALVEHRLPDAQSLIDSRKLQEAHYSKLSPPLVMTSDGEIFTAARRNEKAPPGALIGIPASAGIVEGYVKVVRSLEEGRLNKGDILVAPHTDPGWTPLFHSAKALVTEVGGLMTHGSVVAREYGIPAVVGVEKATTRLKDGQYIRVDGTNGYVEILADSAD